MVWLYLVGLAIALYYVNKWIRSDEQFEKIPGPPGIYIFENALDFLMDPVTLFYYFRKLGSQYKQFFKLKLASRKFIVICNPEDTEAIIAGTKYNKKGFLYGFIEPWLKEGLLLSDGEKWQQRRKILTPTFHFNILRHFNTILEENSRKLVKQLATEVKKDKTDVSTFITEFTLHSICETAMGTKLDSETSSVGRSYKDAIIKLGVYAVHRAQRVWLYPDLIFPWTQLGRKQQKVLDLMRSFRDSVIDKRRESNNIKDMLLEVANDTDEQVISVAGKKRLAMLDLLLQAEREGIIDANGIGEEVDTFMFEGHDTTATALQFTLMLLACYPDAQDKAFEECNQIFKTPDQQTTMSDLSQMKYLECCIKESLRLYPPVHFIMRKLDQPFKLNTGGNEVPAGSDCAILLWELQRRSDQFVEALEFRPERFLQPPTWHPYAFIPFSAGPRNCIGQKFAMNEMKFALSAILRNYRLLPVSTPQNIVFITDFILRPVEHIYVKFENRHPYKLMDLGRDFAKRFHGIYRFWCYPLGAVTIYNPEDIEIIMSTMKHSEKSILYHLLKPWLQEGLLLSNGEKWQTRRKILTPTFHFNILQQFSIILQENAQRLLTVLEAASERPVDVVPVISEFTLSSICETAMGTQLNEQETNAARSYKDTIYKIGQIFSKRFARIYLFSDFIFNYTSLGREQKNLLKIVRNFTKTVIDQKKVMLENNINSDAIKDGEEYDDIFFMSKKKKVAMLDLLISAKKDKLIDSAGIQEEVDTFMFEGHDTTASGLTFCMMALANNRDIQNKAVAELKELFGDSDRAITMEDINKLPFLDRCIKESLRIYPPVHFISRQLTEDVRLSNKYDVPAGVACHISIYDLHHREDLYPDPTRFDPDRFLPEHCARRHPYAYIPFSAGPRNCIGQKFALLEMKLVLAEVLRKFELQPVTRPEDLSFIGDLILRNKGPVYVNFTKRKSAATQ
ncbi:uncharacterized protein LOC134647515 [Cydia amplana]|uniref:uncharacterized protein LOC134647515 n=1 Tax=Cydia amplana TaxID=1869771 RepID=UPI002FE5DCE3